MTVILVSQCSLYNTIINVIMYSVTSIKMFDKKQLSTITYCLEGYVAGLDDLVTQNESDKQLIKDVDSILQIIKEQN